MIKLIVKAQTEEGTKEFSYEYDQPVITIGRLKENDVQLPVSTVSGFHAQILKEGEEYSLMDRGSVNGTSLNGQRLVPGEKKLLRDGDIIQIQNFEIFFSTNIANLNIDQGATMQVARQMVMEVLGSWKATNQEKPRIFLMGGPDNGRQFELSEGKTLVAGRTVECDIVVDHPSVSRRHAEISMSWSGIFINDLGSANGVFVDDQRISGSQKLRDRDEIRLGQQTNPDPLVLVFSNPAEALLSKIENMQITDSTPGVVSSKELTDAVEKGAGKPGVLAAEIPVASPKEELQEPIPEEAASPVEPATNGTSGFRKYLPLAAIGAILLILIVAIIGMILFSRKTSVFSGAAEPAQGGAGDLIMIRGEDLEKKQIQSVKILDRNATIRQVEDDQIQIQLPQVNDLEAGETKTEIRIEGEKGTLAQIPFTFITTPQIQNVNPQSGGVGTEIRIKTNKAGASASVYFGSNQAMVKSRHGTELVALVPQPAETIPQSGLSVPISLKLNEKVSKNNVNFTVLPEQKTPEPENNFELTFVAKPYSESLGFNEYAVDTNIGPFLVLGGKDDYATSRERAEAVAKNLNDAKSAFWGDSTAQIYLTKEQAVFSLSAGGKDQDHRTLLVRILPEDAQVYGKLNRRSVGVEELAEWWKMLLDSYYKVFVQIESPADTGILSAGGSVLQQIYKFYAIGSEQGEKHYDKNLLNQIPSDQRAKLVSLNLILPEIAAARIGGKWAGAMMNQLYKNISAQTLELSLLLRQDDSGNVTGTADMTWKIVMDSSGGSFENVGYKKLGTFNLNGTYRRTRSYPLEFSFIEKDSRRLDFQGKLDGDILKGKYVISSSGEEGNWTVRLVK